MAQIGLAEAEIACGRADAVIVRLEALAAEHPFREPLWAQMITAYYVAERQSDALDAYRRLKANLAENLGIDPGPTVRALHERILRQEPLDTKRTAQTTAMNSVVDLSPHTGTVAGRSAVAELRGGMASGIGCKRRPGSAAGPTTTSFSTTMTSVATTPSSSTPEAVS